MSNLYILNYNNYNNRIVKRLDTINDYIGLGCVYYTLQTSNFNQNDGLLTSHIFGSNASLYDGKGDYLIVVDNNNEIISRWFIIESKRTREGQHNLTLKRDVLADFYNETLDADCYIYKGTPPSGSPYIYTQEDVVLNQIKTNEVLLKDKSNTPWLVGYYAKNTDIDKLTGNINITNLNNANSIAIGTTLEEWEYNKLNMVPTGNTFIRIPICQIKDNIVDTTCNYCILRNSIGNIRETEIYSKYENTLQYTNEDIEKIYPTTTGNDLALEASLRFTNSDINNNEDYKEIIQTEIAQRTTYSQLEEYNNKIISTNDGKFYKLNLKTNNLTSRKIKISTTKPGTSISNILQDVLNKNGINTPNNITYSSGINQGQYLPNNSPESFEGVYLETQNYEFEFTELTSGILSYDMTNEHIITDNSAYNIFCIPYDQIDIVFGDNVDTDLGDNVDTDLGDNVDTDLGDNVDTDLGDNKTIQNNKQIALATIQSIALNMGAFIYDIQLIPYCPVPDMISSDGKIEITNNYQYSPIKQETETTPKIVGVILHCQYSQTTFNIPYFEYGYGGILAKVKSNCDKWRLSSPNFSNYFDFSITKNGGLEYFNVDMDLKPYSPYIHINPNFGNLYGKDFNDCRGLICGGEFSLTQINDAWITYQINNKNYEEIFRSSIQNLEYQHKYGLIQDIAQSTSGIVSGIAGGALTGAMISGGNPIGAGIGALVGGLGSAVGGTADIIVNQKLRNQQVTYATEQHKLQLGNIQALPQTITKLTAITSNNKLFPVLEYYTCTKEEIKDFVRKLQFNGMELGIFGKINRYINYWSIQIDGEFIKDRGYIQATIINFNNTKINIDSHIVNEISQELNKGVYFVWE